MNAFDVSSKEYLKEEELNLKTITTQYLNWEET